MMFENQTWFYLTAAPAALPIGLNHLDWDFCWCDPVVEVDEYGKEVVLHKQVTWN
jgi:hypothetical protein